MAINSSSLFVHAFLSFFFRAIIQCVVLFGDAIADVAAIIQKMFKQRDLSPEPVFVIPDSDLPALSGTFSEESSCSSYDSDGGDLSPKVCDDLAELDDSPLAPVSLRADPRSSCAMSEALSFIENLTFPPAPIAKPDESGKSKESRTLVLKNFPFTINPEDVYQILNMLPHRPQRVVFLRNTNGRFKGTVLVKYYTIQEAIENLRALESPSGLVIEGRTIGVVYKAPKKHKRHAIGDKPQDEDKIASLIGSNLLDTIGRAHTLSNASAGAPVQPPVPPVHFNHSTHPAHPAPAGRPPNHLPAPIGRPKPVHSVNALSYAPFLSGYQPYSQAFACNEYPLRGQQSSSPLFAPVH